MLLNNKKRKRQLFFAVLITISVTGCYYDKEALLYPGSSEPVNCSTTPASFNADILPLITSKCALPGCHDATSSGGYTFQHYDQISAAKAMINVQVIVQKTMPATGALSPSEINKLKCWIDGGGLNN